MKLVFRLLSSNEHNLTVDELIDVIEKTGTDRYDKSRKQVFDDFYGKHDFDFFGTETDDKNADKDITYWVSEFPKKTLGDRKYEVHPDIAIIYRSDRCKMIKNVYDYQEHSDCYKFVGSPLEALIEVRKLV